MGRVVCPDFYNKFLAAGPVLRLFWTFNPGHSVGLIGISKCRAESSHILGCLPFQLRNYTPVPNQ